jgi:tRNA 5-methylaminomethyl-2-thiouridine biosynthesis bifunctional protein
MNPIKNSAINWQDSTPFSTQFDDYYFNSDGGADESLHVFVKPNNISDRYQRANNYLCINETGFGTGLNFYCTLLALDKISKTSDTKSAMTATDRKPIYFYSSELFPLSLADFKKTVASFPHFSDITTQICQQYPPASKGFHRLILNGGDIYLTLMFEDSISAYQRCNHKTDIWYLDGFSPAKNPDMWTDPLFSQISRLSTRGHTTLSSFTSAGFVRRALQAQGFDIKKHSGFGKKREMISATFNPEQINADNKTPWFNYQGADNNKPRVAIIGAGLAGCTTAEALARRGIDVTLFDSSTGICQHASGNLQGALYAKLPSKPTVAGELHLTGLEYSLRLLNVYQCFDKVTAEQCGLLQLATSEKEQLQQQDLLAQDNYSTDIVRWVSAEQASQIAGTATPFSGLFFPRAGWVSPALFCQKLIEHEQITLALNTRITELKQTEDLAWQLHCDDHQAYTFDVVVVASANQATQFEQLQQLPTKAIRGQVTHANKNKASVLNTVVCGAGYICPATDNQFCFGASFDLHNNTTQLQNKDQQTNIANLNKVLPNFAKVLNIADELSGKVAKRCSTPDYLPVVGPAPKHQQFVTQFKKLNKDKHWRFENNTAPNYQGLFINTGHGAKGLITCPLSAEYLACLITNQPSPLAKNLSDSLHPARFVIKQLIRRTI